MDSRLRSRISEYSILSNPTTGQLIEHLRDRIAALEAENKRLADENIVLNRLVIKPVEDKA